MSNIDQTMRGLERASAKVKERRAKEQAKQSDARSAKEKLQQLQAIADLKSQIAVFQNADNASTASTADKISDEQYQTMIIQRMIAHINSKRNPL